MSTVIKAKRSSIPGKIPLVTDLELGEFAINTYDGKLFLKRNVSGTEAIVEVGGAAGGSLVVSNTAPLAGSASFWFDTTDGTLNIYFDDGTSSQWITVVNNQSDPVYKQKTSNYTAINRDRIIADTSGGSFTITLPASPSLGNSVVIYDNASWAINNLTIARNGSTIEGIADDFVLDIASIKVEFIYNGSTWQIYSSIGQSGPAGPALTYADVSALAIALG